MLQYISTEYPQGNINAVWDLVKIFLLQEKIQVCANVKENIPSPDGPRPPPALQLYFWSASPSLLNHT